MTTKHTARVLYAGKRGGRGRPFEPGNAGKPRGARNKVTREIAAYARDFLESADYRASAHRRVLAGRAPHLETLLHHYAFGKPVERVQVDETRQVPELRVLVLDSYGDAPALPSGRPE